MSPPRTTRASRVPRAAPEPRPAPPPRAPYSTPPGGALSQLTSDTRRRADGPLMSGGGPQMSGGDGPVWAPAGATFTPEPPLSSGPLTSEPTGPMVSSDPSLYGDGGLSSEPGVSIDPGVSTDPGASYEPNASFDPSLSGPNMSVDPSLSSDPDASTTRPASAPRFTGESPEMQMGARRLRAEAYRRQLEARQRACLSRTSGRAGETHSLASRAPGADPPPSSELASLMSIPQGDDQAGGQSVDPTAGQTPGEQPAEDQPAADGAATDAAGGGEVEAADEAPLFEASGLAPAAPLPTLEDLMAPEGAPMDAGTLPPPDQEQLSPAAARARMAGISAGIHIAWMLAHDRVMGAANLARDGLHARAAARRESIRSQVGAMINQLEIAFGAHSDTIASLYDEAARTVEQRNTQRAREATMRVGMSRRAIASLFRTKHRAARTAVNNKVTEASNLRSRWRGIVRTRINGAAGRARRMGMNYSRRFSWSERGRVQARAATETAGRAAREIEGRLQPNLDAVTELTEGVPQSFRQEAPRATAGFMDPLPEIQGQLDPMLNSATSALAVQGTYAVGALMEARASALRQVEQMRERALERAHDMQTQGLRQIDHALSASLAAVNATEQQALDQMRPIAHQAMQRIDTAQHPAPARAAVFAQRIIQFLEGASTDVANSLSEGGGMLGGRFAQVEHQVNSSLMALERRAADSTADHESRSRGAVNTLIGDYDDRLIDILFSLEDALIEFEGHVETELDNIITATEEAFDEAIGEVEGEIRTAVNEGLAENATVLRELPAAMREAASDAAWDYDHPVLSTLRDVALIVAGVVLAIIAIVLLVIIVIVAAKVIIAGLVALGVSAAVAKGIVVVAGLLMLGYGVYSAYDSRVQRGESGGIGTFFAAVGDVVGITHMAQAFDPDSDLSPFERGFSFGWGLGTLATTFFGGRLNKAIGGRLGALRGRLPRPTQARLFRMRTAWNRFTNPRRGVALSWLGGRMSGLGGRLSGLGGRLGGLGSRLQGLGGRLQGFGQRLGQKPLDPGLATRGYRPAPGERNMTRAQWKAQHRANRIAARQNGQPPRTGGRPGRPTRPNQAPIRAGRPTRGGQPVRRPNQTPRPQAAGPSLPRRGYRPAPGERSMSRAQWRAQNRADRIARQGGVRAPRRPTGQQAEPISLIGRGDRLARALRWVRRADGMQDVVIHGSNRSFHVLHNGRWVRIDHRSLARFLRINGYTGDRPIRLLSCGSGGRPDGIARNLANKLGVEVHAPSDTLWIHSNGRLTIGATSGRHTGQWNLFRPGRGTRVGHSPLNAPPRTGRPVRPGRSGTGRGAGSRSAAPTPAVRPTLRRLPGETLNKQGITRQQEAWFRQRIDTATSRGNLGRADRLRYRRYLMGRRQRSLPRSSDLSRFDHRVAATRIRMQGARGRLMEQQALDDLGIPNNNRGTPTTHTHGGVTTRPDAVQPRSILEIKATSGVQYRTTQIRTQQHMGRQIGGGRVAPEGVGRRHVTIITGGPRGGVRPSAPLARTSRVLHRDPSTGQWSMWDGRAGIWRNISRSSARRLAGGMTRGQWSNQPISASGGGNHLLPNQVPENLASELASAASVGARPMRAGAAGFDDLLNAGTIKWIITESGELIVGPHTLRGVEISHAVLSGGAPVQAAGQANIAASGGMRFGVDISAHSGHFMNGMPEAMSARVVELGKAAFSRVGVSF